MGSWLQDHLKDFVEPYLGYVPLKNDLQAFFNADEMAVIKNAWRSTKDSFKHSGCSTLVLPGRDVFVFEILARREGFPTLFIPQCSRMTSSYMIAPSNSFIMDTGFIGSIPMKLCVNNFKLLSFVKNRTDLTKQVFPRLSGSRSLALKIESTPKYWKSARMLEGKVYQELTDKDEFARAAILTIQVYCDSSPSFSNKRSCIRRQRWTLT